MKTGQWQLLVLLLGLSAGEGVANPPAQSVYPVARPLQTSPERPDRMVLIDQATGVRVSLRPIVRPRDIRDGKAAVAGSAPIPASIVVSGGKRRLCGTRTILGDRLAPIRGRLSGCAIQDPVRVSVVSGVALSQASIMDCTTAKALDSWVANSVKSTLGRLGGGVQSLQVAAHYSCRTRNSKPGARISEHGKGRAIDISAINLRNGISVSVLKGWRDVAQGKILRALHKSACGPFGTVLGPNADRHHQDHFHLDTARYRSGSYCR